ncbi:MAG TPA: TIGR01906 family membrane protein [Candidatus Limnocylindrales bacterium]
MPTVRGALASVVIGLAAALVVVAVAILPFLAPPWVGFEQGRAQATAWTGFTDEQLHAVTSSVLHDLVLGPPDFLAALPGQTDPVLKPGERAHMRDVRGVFAGFYIVAIVGALILAAAFLLARGRPARARLWRRLARTGTVIAVVTVVGGGIGVLVFDQAFTLFHEIFFPGGNWQFDPRTDRLVQLFPDQFWSETTVAVGITIIVLALGLRWLGGRRAGSLERAGSSAVLAAAA